MRCLALLLAFCTPAAFAQATLNAPPTVRAGAPVQITVSGSKDPRDFVTIVPATLRVNIVGFAIDDAKLATTFRHWSDLGSGAYFDAKDAKGLNDALSQAVRPAFEVVNAGGQVVAEGLAGGEPVRVMPGNYTVRLTGRKGASQPVSVRAKETATARL